MLLFCSSKYSFIVQTNSNKTPEIIVGQVTTLYILVDSLKTLSMTVHRQGIKMRSATVNTLGAANRQESHGHGINNHNSYCYPVWQQDILTDIATVAMQLQVKGVHLDSVMSWQTQGRQEGASSKQQAQTVITSSLPLLLNTVSVCLYSVMGFFNI